LEVEPFDDPGDGGDMLEPAGLIFPLVEFGADDFFLLGGEKDFAIFGEEV
jgi:hypothetical protein